MGFFDDEIVVPVAPKEKLHRVRADFGFPVVLDDPSDMKPNGKPRMKSFNPGQEITVPVPEDKLLFLRRIGAVED